MTCYSLDFRKKIIEAHKEGYSVRKIAERFMINPNTVQKLITKYRATGDLTPLKCGTKKPSVLSQHEELVLEMVEKYPDWVLREYCEYLRENHGIIVNTSMMFRFFAKHKITLKKKLSEMQKLSVKKYNRND